MLAACSSFAACKRVNVSLEVIRRAKHPSELALREVGRAGLSNPRPTDHESLDSARATRQNGELRGTKSPARHQIWSLPLRSRYAPGTGTNRPRVAGVTPG